MTKYLHARFLALMGSILCLGLTSQAEEEDWLENYYKNPTPERFVEHMKDWAADGTLDNEIAKPAVIAFTSQLLRQNRDQIESWYTALSGLSPTQMQLLHTAMLFSRTSEADKIMRAMFGREYDEQKVETKKILEMPLDKPNTIDMLWGFFYATGSENAVRRVAAGFTFLDAPENPDGVDVPKGYMPLYKSLPIVTFNSLLANAERHPRVLEALKALNEDGDLSPREKEGVYDVLSEIDPKAYPPVDRGNTRA